MLKKIVEQIGKVVALICSDTRKQKFILSGSDTYEGGACCANRGGGCFLRFLANFCDLMLKDCFLFCFNMVLS